ncbi:hypothetical protein BM1_02146 [Bipolaris maydis]|nr:hypothetical protein BM1_02146 [Bipolaris maydis]
MDQLDEAVNSGGGAVFHDIQAGRDITINHFTEIRQVTEYLYNHCCGARGVSDNLLGRVDVLHGTAEFVEEYAKELQASLPPNDPQLQRVFRECASIVFDLRRLVLLIEDNSCNNGADTSGFSPLSLNEEIIEFRFRLMSLQANLSLIHNKNMRQNFDTNAIKRAIAELINVPENSEDTASINTFYTASSIPYVERQMWREIERALRGRFTADFVRDNYALIVDTVEETVWENSIPRRGDTATLAPIVTMESAVPNTMTPTAYRSDRLGTPPGVIDEGAEDTTVVSQTEQRLSDLRLTQYILSSYTWFIVLDFPITSSRFTRIFFPLPKYEPFRRLINISFSNSNVRKWSMFVFGVVIFDTQCDDNLVTSRFLNEKGIEWQTYESGIGSSTIDGTKMEFLGEVLGRWYIVKSSNRDNVPPRYEIATFKVIDCQECQVIIGRNTIKDLAMPTMFEELRPSRFSGLSKGKQIPPSNPRQPYPVATTTSPFPNETTQHSRT